MSAELEDYDRALEYYNKTLEICERMEDAYGKTLFSNINIAALYRRKGDFKTAEQLYEKLKKDELIKAAKDNFDVSLNPKDKLADLEQQFASLESSVEVVEEAPAGPSQEDLLAEIRDLLKK